jgi:type IV pilus assembly protein PilN
MIQINLLPVRQIRARLKTRNEVAVYLFSIALLLAAVSLASLNMISEVEQRKIENKQLTEKKASYQPILNEIDQLKKDKQTQQTKINVIKTLKKNSHVTVRVLDELTNLVPAKRLWLNSLSQTGKSLSVSGVALDNATIAQFMNNISASDHFSGSELASSSQTVVSGAKLKSFSLKITIS